MTQPNTVLFVPGRYSERVYSEREDCGIDWELAPASRKRAQVAAATFDPEVHSSVVFSAGWPGFENWKENEIPPKGQREADGMAAYLQMKLRGEGWKEAEIAERVKVQNDSNSSIGDVRLAAEADYFAECDEVEVVAGALHGARFRPILHRVREDRLEVSRVGMRDIYGREASDFRPKREGPTLAVLKETAAVALTHRIMLEVEPGDLEGMARAEERFNETAVAGLAAVGMGILTGRAPQMDEAA